MLKNDYYHFDSIKHSLLGERSGKSYRLGDVVQVKVARVDLDKRQMDFVIADDVVQLEKKKRRKKKNLL
jgi:ribonuclease R